jgi:drug/metabolite transporter (DMT)-like permease
MNKHGGGWRMVLAMTLSGTIGAFVLVSGQTPQTVVWFRCLIGGAALLGWLRWNGGWKRPDLRALGWIALGAASLIANWLCLFSAYRLSSISIATVVYQVQPFFLILLAALAQRELPARHKLPWLALAFVGVALSTGIDLRGGHGQLMNGVMLALAAAFLYALTTLATRKLGEYPPAQIAGLQLLLGAVVLAPLTRVAPASISLASWSILLVIGLVHTGLVYELMYAAFQRLRADAIATLSFIYPLVAVAVDLAFFGTRLSLVQMTGMGMILASVLANQRGAGAAVRVGVQAR